MKNLTHIQNECLNLLVQGKTKKEIAAQLKISPSTVYSHLHSAYKKLGVSSSTQAVVKYMESGGSVVPQLGVDQARKRLDILSEAAYHQGNTRLGNELASIAELLG